MTDQEYEAIYTELVEILNSNHFSWIVDYVEGVVNVKGILSHLLKQN